MNFIRDSDNCAIDETETTYNNISKPRHYMQGMECIEEMIAVFGKEKTSIFCLLNVWKYRKRAYYKNGIEDLKKAEWYMHKYCELTGGESK